MTNKNSLIYSNWDDYCKSLLPYGIKRHEQILGKKPNLIEPKRFTDKLEWLKFFDSTMLKTLCSDKIAVRDYVFNKIGKDIFIPILKIYDNVNQIDFSKLPLQYILKTNHGSHTNIIVKNNQNIDIQKIKEKLTEWMGRDWSWWGYELFYKRIDRKIFIEKYMQDENQKNSLIDYKFLCFNGKPKFCQVISDRFSNKKHLNYYDMNWNPQIRISRKDFPANYNIIHKRPKTFELMKEYSLKLSKDFKFVRVDFYEINGKLFFGELTFCPGAAYFKYTDDTIDFYFGNELNLS